MIQGKLAELFVDITARNQAAPAIAEVQGRAANLRAELAKIGTSGWGSQVGAFLSAQRDVALNQEKLRGEALKVETQYVSSPQGRKAIQEQIAAQKASAEEQKKLNRAMDVASLGKFGAVVKQMREGLDGMADRLGATAGFFGVMGAAATGAVAAASPDAFKTFTMSLQYLAASVGQAVLPAFMEIVRWIQQAARWFQGLDEGTKRLIGTFAGWSIAIGGLAFVGARLIAVLGPMLRLLQAIAALRFGGALLGLGGVVGALVIAGEMSDPRSSGGLVYRGVRDMVLGGGISAVPRSTTEELGRRELDRRESLGYSRRDGMRAAIEDMADAMFPGIAAERRGVISGGAFGGMREAMLERSRSIGPAPAITAPGGGMARTGIAVGGVGGRVSSGIGDSSPSPSPLMLASNFQSQFLGIEAQWKSLQQMAASDSPLEAEMRRIAQESRDSLVAIAGHTSRIGPGTPPTRS